MKNLYERGKEKVKTLTNSKRVPRYKKFSIHASNSFRKEIAMTRCTVRSESNGEEKGWYDGKEDNRIKRKKKRTGLLLPRQRELFKKLMRRELKREKLMQKLPEKLRDSKSEKDLVILYLACMVCVVSGASKKFSDLRD